MGLLSSPGRPAKGWGEGAGILARTTAVLREGERGPRYEENECNLQWEPPRAGNRAEESAPLCGRSREWGSGEGKRTGSVS